MNACLFHYFRKKDYCKRQQYNKNSIFSSACRLLILFHGYFQINSEIRIINIPCTRIPIIHYHLRIIPVQI